MSRLFRSFILLPSTLGSLCVAAGWAQAPPTASLGPGDHRLWLNVGELRREFLVHVPDRYSPGRAAPLLLMFHGSGGSLDEISRASGWIATSEDEGFVVVFPNGFPNDEGMRVWNDGRAETDGRNRVDDVAFVRALLGDLSRRLDIDRKRIYVVGFSNGAGLAFRLGAELADLVASIAPVAGGLAVNPTALRRRVPMMYIIGTRDGGFRPGPRSASSRWATLLGCHEQADTVREGRFSRIAYRGCPAHAEAVAYYVEGWEHYWPGGGNRGIEMWAERTIWKFFAAHPLR